MDNMEERGEPKPIVVILVGPPGSGKSTFCDQVIEASSRPWVRICQDIVNNGKSGTKAQCLKNATIALKDGKSVFIDRCNLDREQRAEFVKLGDSVNGIHVHAIVLDLPAQLCISRSVKRTAHEGNLHGGKAAAVVNRMLQKKELPILSEGFFRITVCRTEKDVQDAIVVYRTLGPSDTLSSGSFGQKSPGAKVQVGILKFLKKADGPANLKPASIVSEISFSSETTQAMISEKAQDSPSQSYVPQETNDMENSVTEPVGQPVGVDSAPDSAPTLAFPSISTSDFQFDMKKASEVVIETVQEFASKLGNARLVLVDLSHNSKILSLVKAEAAWRNIDSNRFFTFVGDITCLFSEGGLHCNVIANATNRRLKPGGGGVNAAIFNAAGPELEVATKQQASSLSPGKAVVVPLPSSSPLNSREGVTHVIHVLGPNMNPHRPNCLNSNYDEGCKVLRQAYSSLFNCFLSITDTSKPRSSQENSKKPRLELQESQNRSLGKQGKKNSPDQKIHRESTAKAWGSWAQALYDMAMYPERHKSNVLEFCGDDVIVVTDLYPKGKRHVLVLARVGGLDCLKDVSREHVELLKLMHEAGTRWAAKFLQDDASLIFRLGYHSAPSMRQLHLHVISQDFDSPHLKHKKHWNSFNTDFFRDSVEVIKEVSSEGKATIREEESLLSMELRCHRCRSAHPNMPRLKSHIRNCQAAFPPTLLSDGRLVQAPTTVGRQ
ncbi:hypothetical protein Dimus_033195 [Dionaea muscipula]